MVTTGMEEIRKRGRPWERWTDEVYKALRTVGIRNWHTLTIERKEWRITVLEAKSHRGIWCLTRRKSRNTRRGGGMRVGILILATLL